MGCNAVKRHRVARRTLQWLRLISSPGGAAKFGLRKREAGPRLAALATLATFAAGARRKTRLGLARRAGRASSCPIHYFVSAAKVAARTIAWSTKNVPTRRLSQNSGSNLFAEGRRNNSRSMSTARGLIRFTGFARAKPREEPGRSNGILRNCSSIEKAG
jgi:hypothetical protein